MLILKSYKFRLKPNQGVKQQFEQIARNCHFVWNKSLAIQKERLDARSFWQRGLALNTKLFKFGCLSYFDLSAKLPGWKTEYDFLNESPHATLQQTLKDLSRSIRESFNKKLDRGFPHFKHRRSIKSFRFPVSYSLPRVEDKKIKLPRIGWVSFFKSREIKGTMKNVTVSKRGEHWFVSIQTKQECPDVKHPSKKEVAIDLAVKNFATFSNKKKIYPVNEGKRKDKKLAKLQQELALKVKFSSNWKKQKKKITKLHQKIRNRRQDFLHKESNKISKEYETIYMEELNIKGMTKSAKKTESADVIAKVKTKVNKAILDQGWYEFRRQLDYKSVWRGGNVTLVNPANTSRTCPECGAVHKDHRKDGKFQCLSCDYKNDAYYVAAINILAAGHAVTAFEEKESVKNAKPNKSKDQSL
jgi:putative transposase